MQRPASAVSTLRPLLSLGSLNEPNIFLRIIRTRNNMSLAPTSPLQREIRFTGAKVTGSTPCLVLRTHGATDRRTVPAEMT